ncbi:MAG: hypothetical protein JW954_07380 [Dehalococcoidaceae bacterium]|nr:hypothetical protein [Dehalococcoidaceae bacterium]
MKRLLIIVMVFGVVSAGISCGETGQEPSSTLPITNSTAGASTAIPPTTSTSQAPSTVPPATTTELPYIPPDINVNYIVIFPDAAVISSGESQEFTAKVFLLDGSELNITPYVEYSIDADAGGSWRFNTYTSENPGTWTVTGIYLHPSAGCIFFSDTAEITILPVEPTPNE